MMTYLAIAIAVLIGFIAGKWAERKSEEIQYNQLLKQWGKYHEVKKQRDAGRVHPQSAITLELPDTSCS